MEAGRNNRGIHSRSIWRKAVRGANLGKASGFHRSAPERRSRTEEISIPCNKKPATIFRRRSISALTEGLVHLIEFDTITRVHIFHREDDHAGCSCIGYADDDDL